MPDTCKWNTERGGKGWKDDTSGNGKSAIASCLISALVGAQVGVRWEEARLNAVPSGNVAVCVCVPSMFVLVESA